MAEYIEREAARTLIKNYGKGAVADGMKTLDPVDDIISLAGGVDLIPAADVAPVRHGRWLPYKTPIETRQSRWICNHCSGVVNNVSSGDTYYCPNCGARMDLEAQHETAE